MAQHGVKTAIEGEAHTLNRAAPGVPYFTPAQDPVAGTALHMKDEGQSIPKLFTPLKIRGLTLQNRIMLSPLCQYSADDGHFTAWHMAHLGGIISRGPGIAFIEATAIQARGRITPEDSGLWKDSQIEPLKKVTDFVHSQGQKIGIQLAHAGRKASTAAPWLAAFHVQSKELGGWPEDVIAPSAIGYSPDFDPPKAMTKDDIEELKADWKSAILRAVKAGFDAIEIHGAHGYLLSSFHSPAANHRTDEYGGSFENRTRLTLEVVDIARATIPKDMPLFLRISATDWLEETDIQGWTVEETVKLAEILAERGVDLLDVSSGGNHSAQKIKGGPGYQAPFAKAVKDRVGDKMLVGTVGTITEGKQANDLLVKDDLDLAIAGRMFQKNPGLVWAWADDLGVVCQWANQIRWGFGGRGKK